MSRKPIIHQGSRPQTWKERTRKNTVSHYKRHTLSHGGVCYNCRHGMCRDCFSHNCRCRSALCTRRRRGVMFAVDKVF